MYNNDYQVFQSIHHHLLYVQVIETELNRCNRTEMDVNVLEEQQKI